MTATVEHPEAPPGGSRPRRPRRAGASDLTGGDRLVGNLLGVAALLPALALVFLAYEMVKEAWPAIRFNGWGFFTSKVFTFGNTYSTAKAEVRHGYIAAPGAHYGVLVLLFGTLVSSLIALVVAVPISVGGAILLVERMPRRVQGVLGGFLELLAGIPSVVFGFWGYLTFGPFMARYVYRWINDLHIPWLHGQINPDQGVLTASLVLAAMIIPIIASTTRELVRSVPALTKEGAVALGLTGSESVRLITIPFVRTGIVAASLLGWARALGETIAVAIIGGTNLSGYPHSIFSTFTTMASTIVNTLDSGFGVPLALNALAEVGLVLLVITLLTNFGGRLITRRFGGAELPVGRGI